MVWATWVWSQDFTVPFAPRSSAFSTRAPPLVSTGRIATAPLDRLTWPEARQASTEVAFCRWHASWRSGPQRAELVRQVCDALADPTLFADVHASVGAGGYDVSEWAQNAVDEPLTRTVKFVHPLQYKIGPKETRVVETHRWSRCSRTGGATLEIESRSLDVPCASKFAVIIFVDIAGSSTEPPGIDIRVTTAPVIFQPFFIQGIVRRGAVSDTRPFYSALLTSLQKRLGPENFTARAPAPIPMPAPPPCPRPVPLATANYPHLTSLSSPSQPFAVMARSGVKVRN